ncbi:ZIP zinc transporter-domain-containing protein [Chaetomidium leptoderma]|uniref:ZIP zinc transporter-domain-containing protein n=1 Tax=Chaetomidium leptoderma TaxID=669021 RepID=A0AAN6VGW6_9PEZI|nr:ZIP zinc transporter-domain-containing protein [Chaetomidium leptoderma]
MAQFPSTLRASALYGLLAVSSAGAVSPTPSPLHQRAPHVDTSVSDPNPATITAISECHLHETELFCMAGASEYLVHTSVTATQDIPPAFTGCHSHGTETFCIAPNGDDVEVHPAGEEEEGDDHASSASQNCHFHAGVEHCTGPEGESSPAKCDRVERDYNIRLRVGLLFAMLLTSAIGVFTPILVASYISPKHAVFTILRQFGTGVIISTAFVHLYTHATLMFQNECLGELSYESTASAILMAGLFLSFLVEYAGSRLIQWHESKAKPSSDESVGHAHAAPPARTDMVNITVLEIGVIFHSLLIGLTLVVAGDSFFLTLFAVIVFHQMFEGLALGTRIAALGRPCPTSAPASGHGHGHGATETPGHNHAHGHEHYHNHDEPTAATAATTDGTTEPKAVPTDSSNSTHTTTSAEAGPVVADVSMRKKLLLALAFALVTPVGMGIGIGVLHNFNGNDPATIIAIGTLDALSAGILVWVGVVEMWAHDWMLGGEMTRASPLRTGLGMVALVVGMALMSLLGKWA